MYPRAPVCPRSPTIGPHTPEETSPHSTYRPARRSEHSAQQMTYVEGEICQWKKSNNNYSESERASLSASCSHQSHAHSGTCRQGQITTLPAKWTVRHTSATRTQKSRQGRTEAHRENFTKPSEDEDGKAQRALCRPRVVIEVKRAGGPVVTATGRMPVSCWWPGGAEKLRSSGKKKPW